jgi:hypothetical protein
MFPFVSFDHMQDLGTVAGAFIPAKPALGICRHRTRMPAVWSLSKPPTPKEVAQRFDLPPYSLNLGIQGPSDWVDPPRTLVTAYHRLRCAGLARINETHRLFWVPL